MLPGKAASTEVMYGLIKRNAEMMFTGSLIRPTEFPNKGVKKSGCTPYAHRYLHHVITLRIMILMKTFAGHKTAFIAIKSNGLLRIHMR